jgi:hypothetical protein
MTGYVWHAHETITPPRPFREFRMLTRAEWATIPDAAKVRRAQVWRETVTALAADHARRYSSCLRQESALAQEAHRDALRGGAA